MYKIFMVDRVDYLVEYVLEHTDWEIEVLITQEQWRKRKYSNNNRIKEVYDATEFFELEADNIDFNYVHKFEKCFRRYNYGMLRLKHDVQYARYQFVSGLSIWKEKFDKYDIDFCMFTSIEHGWNCDTLMIETARKRNIPCYNVVEAHGICTVYNQLTNSFLEVKNQVSREQIYKMYCDAAYYLTKDNKDTEFHVLTPKEKIFKFLADNGGTAFMALYRCYRDRSLNFTWYDDRNIKTNCFKFLYKFFMWKFNFYMKKKMYQKVDYNEKYIVYFLHFEPEAVVVHNANTVDSQLINILILAKSLPKGWKLYIKEHPVAKKLNSERSLGYFIEYYPDFNSIDYWKKIVSISNVKLISEASATDLIKHSQVVSTMAGTVIKEALLEHKPVLAFGDARKIVYSSMKGYFPIDSTENCRRAIDKINAGKVTFSVEDIYSLRKYVVAQNSDGYDAILEMINSDIGKHCARETMTDRKN